MIPKSKKHKMRVFYTSFAIIAVVFFVSIAFIQYYLMQEKQLENTFYPHVSINGRDIGRKTKTEVLKDFSIERSQITKSAITVMYRDEPIATLSAEQLNIRLNIEDVADRAYLVGRSSNPPSRFYQKIATIFNLQQYNFTTAVIFDTGTVEEIARGYSEGYDKPAKNALFKFEDNKVTTFREHENGLRVKTDEFLKNMQETVATLEKKPGIKTVVLKEEIIKPEITLEKSNNFGIVELIGEGQSDYTHSIPERVHNVKLAASKFDGVLIPKDKIISFNDIIGDISAITGYKPAYVIKNGKTVLGDGGGVCQVSSTLFRVALNTGLPILERTAHAYRVGYYENDSKPGLDATIYSPSVDLKIKNDTPASILIQTEIDEENNILKFKFYGKKDNRTVELSPITLYDVVPAPPPIYQDDPTLPSGVVKQVDFAAGGAKSQFTYKVKKGDKTVIDKTFYSVYRPWAAVFLVGKQE